ncbi:MAG: sugar transporter substrate-binding protein [Proteobacteria bacterium]|nr:sugar transporter substrate-binding protein [Pseudomonadota bacterium]
MRTTFRSTICATVALAFMAGSAWAAELAKLNSDTEKDRIAWSELDAKFGPLPALKSGLRVGGVSKTLTNEYWRSLGEGYQKYADKVGVSVVYQAAQSEGDQLGQLTIAEGLITQGYDVLLVSPQTDANLQPMMEQAKAANIPVVNVNDAVIPSAEHYVGNVQRDNGVRVARWFITPKSSRLLPQFPATGIARPPMTRRPISCSSIPTSSASTATTTAWPLAWSKRSRQPASPTKWRYSAPTASPTPMPRSRPAS